MVMVAICDDETKISADLERALIDIFDKLNVEYEIDVFFGGTELVRHLEAGTHYDLIFLDIEFAKEEINGVEVGRLIRDSHQNNTVSIVFISWEKKYAMQLFEIRPLNFWVKPLEDDKIEHTVRTHLNITGLWARVFVYKKGYDTVKVQIKEIIYVESRDRKLILHLANGREEEFYGSLKEIYEEQLKKFNFLFIHASYVVNYEYVASMKYNQLFLMNRTTPLPISQNKREAVRKNYYEIMKRRRV